VAMVDDEIQRTRCVVCEAEHEFKKAKVPAQRKRSTTAALFTQVLDALDQPPAGRPATQAAGATDAPREPEEESPPFRVPAPPASPTAAVPPDHADDRPFRRSLIRAQLPRPEGQPPPRAIPEFTMHQPLNHRGKRGGAGRFRRRPGHGAGAPGGPMRIGREHGQGSGHGSGHGGRRRRRKKH
jgi:hypothetical protein